MSSCPFCQTELSDDFGLIDCPVCEASLFIEMDGSVRSSEDSPSEDLPPPIDQVSESSEEFLLGELGDEPPEPEAETENIDERQMEPLEDFESFESFDSVESPESSPLQEEDAELQIPASVTDGAHTEMDMTSLATAMDERGVVEGLRYDLTISGIDTADLRTEVFESFVDKRLGWDVDQLMNSITHGVLEMKAVPAIKAHVIVQRLKSLPLQIRWDQYGES